MSKDAIPHELDAAVGRTTVKVRRLALGSIAAAIAIVPAVVQGGMTSLGETGMALGAVPWLLQVVLGLHARDLATRELARIDDLGLAAPLAKTGGLRVWRRVGSIVGFFGLVGVFVLGIGFVVLTAGLGAALGGAWGR